MINFDDIEGNPRSGLLNNNFDELMAGHTEDPIIEDAVLDPIQQQPLKSSLKKSKGPTTEQPKKRKNKADPGMASPPPYGYPMMPPMWPMPPPGMPVPYRRRGDRQLAYRSTDGWMEGSDSDEEYVKDPSKVPGEAAFQAYIMIAMVVVVLGTIGSVKLWEMFYGKPEIPENKFDF